VLSFAPCSDSVECNEGNKTEQSHNSHNHEKERCTPFCICACCGQHIVSKFNYPLAQSILKREISNNSKAIYTQIFISQFSATIWQPPKIS